MEVSTNVNNSAGNKWLNSGPDPQQISDITYKMALIVIIYVICEVFQPTSSLVDVCSI